jgi:hypothetical protein
MPVVPYYLGRPAQAWIAAMSGPARAATENSCAATSLATATFPASRDPPCRPSSERRRRKPVPAATVATASAWEGRPELASSYESQARVAVRRCKAVSAGGPHVAFPPGRPWTPASPMSRRASALDSAQLRARRRVAASAVDG